MFIKNYDKIRNYFSKSKKKKNGFYTGELSGVWQRQLQNFLKWTVLVVPFPTHPTPSLAPGMARWSALLSRWWLAHKRTCDKVCVKNKKSVGSSSWNSFHTSIKGNLMEFLDSVLCEDLNHSNSHSIIYQLPTSADSSLKWG